MVALFCTVVHANKYDAVPGTCWKFVQDIASDLARKLNYTTAMNDMLFSNDVINQSISTKIRKQLSDAKWTSAYTHTLLMDVLPKTDNVRNMKSCCLLRVKSNVPLMGKILCDKCKAFEKCTVNQTAKFFIPLSCQLFLNNITDQNVYTDAPVDVNYVNETEIEKPVVVHPSSFVCIFNKVLATLTISVEEEYINKELQEKITSTLKADVSKVHVKFSRTNSPWMLLSLSAQAGLRLKQKLNARESKHYFAIGLMIAEAFHLESARNVSIELPR